MRLEKRDRNLFLGHILKVHIQTIFCLTVFLFSFMHLWSKVPTPPFPIDTTRYAAYPFIRFVASGTSEIEPLSDEEFLDKAGKVVFRVNRYDVFTNDSLLTLLEREVLPMINRDSLHLVRIELRGAASPEGPYANNRMLGQRRVQTLYDFLHARLAVPVNEGMMEMESISEDYRLLLVMMRRAGDPQTDFVQRLCDRHLPNNEYTLLKSKLQVAENGRLWKHLLKDYFPQLRAARVVLYFEQKEEEPDEAEGGKGADKPNEPNEPGPYKPNRPH